MDRRCYTLMLTTWPKGTEYLVGYIYNDVTLALGFLFLFTLIIFVLIFRPPLTSILFSTCLEV